MRRLYVEAKGQASECTLFEYTQSSAVASFLRSLGLKLSLHDR